MHTCVDDCQFVCIAQADYYRILHQVMSTQDPLDNSNTINLN